MKAIRHGIQRQAQAMMKEMDPVAGEMRRVYECTQCGAIFGRRYIPHGLGFGYTYNPCLCRLTGDSPGQLLLAERSP